MGAIGGALGQPNGSAGSYIGLIHIKDFAMLMVD